MIGEVYQAFRVLDRVCLVTSTGNVSIDPFEWDHEGDRAGLRHTETGETIPYAAWIYVHRLLFRPERERISLLSRARNAEGHSARISKLHHKLVMESGYPDAREGAYMVEQANNFVRARLRGKPLLGSRK